MTGEYRKARSGPAGRESLRREIQALRALAVAIVVVYHLWPHALPGGFTGVDVFFAISGFLITAQLLREVEQTGRVSVPRFWARRARRILPAALLTLAVCGLATIAFVPDTLWDQYLADVRASVLYVENWHLAANAVDYLHAEDQPSPVQHFWSLSAEEQSYLVWPLLILGAATVAARRKAAIATVLGTVTVASLTYSVLYTESEPAIAFFVTPTRAWEFGAGGLLAIVAGSSGRRRRGVSMVGLAAIAASAVLYSDATPFPGAAALLPVLGTLAVIWAAAPGRVLRARPVQFMGDISYSVYLWHWPLIILVPLATGRALETPTKLLLVLLTIAAAWATKWLVEDPVRRAPVLVRGPARITFAVAATGMAVVFAVAVAGTSRLDDELRAAEAATHRTLAAAPNCFGAAARDPRHPCRNSRLRLTVVPSPLEAVHEKPSPCEVVRRSRPEVCAFGVRRSRAAETVALVGDSHAVHWRPALRPSLRERRWWGLTFYQTGCPFTAAQTALTGSLGEQCEQWNRDVLRWLRRHPEVHTMFTSAHRGAGAIPPRGMSEYEAKVHGFITRWNELPPSVRHIVVLRDIPYSVDETLPCIERAVEHRRAPGPACALPLDVALQPDPAAEAVRRLASPRVELIDLNDYMCGPRTCEPVIGGVLVRRNKGHFTRLFSRTLGPFLRREFDAISADWEPRSAR